jgi:glycosyltransferase involved in cell wall biosynthesis
LAADILLPARKVTMSDVTRASVIIPTFKRVEMLRNLLNSLAGQITDYRYEVIVVNDYPGDDLSPLELEYSDTSVRVINLSEDHGRSVARNTGVRNSSGDVLIFLDDDMTVVKGFVEAHMRAHQEAGRAVIGNIISAPEFASDPLARYIERQGAKKRKPGEQLPPHCFRTGNGSILRKDFLAVGMFDESFRTYGEDLDLSMRLSGHGLDFYFAEEAISYNHDPPDLGDMLAKMREWGKDTMPVLAERHPELARIVWAHLATPVRLGDESLSLSLKKMALRFSLNPLFYGIARLIYPMKFLGRHLFRVIDYLRLYNYLGAYRRALREKARQKGENST